jgi:hypothetical protein
MPDTQLEQALRAPTLIAQQQQYALIIQRFQEFARFLQEMVPAGPYLDKAMDNLAEALTYIQLAMSGGVPP